MDRVRICAQLVDARHQTQLWAAPYERTLGDVLSVQCEVAQAITDEIRLALSLKGRGVRTDLGPDRSRVGLVSWRHRRIADGTPGRAARVL